MTPAAQFRPIRGATVSSSSAPESRSIPFDYAFRFKLLGQPDNVINAIVTVSIEAAFTAVSIGYGVIPKVDPIVFGPELDETSERSLASVELGEIINGLDAKLTGTSTILKGETGPEAVLKNGIKLNSQVAEAVLANPGLQLPNDIFTRLFQVVGSPPELIQFKYAIFDEGSGREFQSEPILNIAGLGSAGGERPFRHFAKPIVFGPRSTIRMEVTEVSDFIGELQVSLHGYKVLGGQNSPTAVSQSRPGPLRRR